VGLLGFAGLRLWEFGDAVIAPMQHNRELHVLRRRLGYPEEVIGLPGLRALARRAVKPRDGVTA
jgi:hypothetical protein